MSMTITYRSIATGNMFYGTGTKWNLYPIPSTKNLILTSMIMIQSLILFSITFVLGKSSNESNGSRHSILRSPGGPGPRINLNKPMQPISDLVEVPDQDIILEKSMTPRHPSSSSSCTSTNCESGSEELDLPSRASSFEPDDITIPKEMHPILGKTKATTSIHRQKDLMANLYLLYYPLLETFKTKSDFQQVTMIDAIKQLPVIYAINQQYVVEVYNNADITEGHHDNLRNHIIETGKFVFRCNSESGSKSKFDENNEFESLAGPAIGISLKSKRTLKSITEWIERDLEEFVNKYNLGFAINNDPKYSDDSAIETKLRIVKQKFEEKYQILKNRPMSNGHDLDRKRELSTDRKLLQEIEIDLEKVNNLTQLQKDFNSLEFGNHIGKEYKFFTLLIILGLDAMSRDQLDNPHLGFMYWQGLGRHGFASLIHHSDTFIRSKEIYDLIMKSQSESVSAIKYAQNQKDFFDELNTELTAFSRGTGIIGNVFKDYMEQNPSGKHIFRVMLKEKYKFYSDDPNHEMDFHMNNVEFHLWNNGWALLIEGSRHDTEDHFKIKNIQRLERLMEPYKKGASFVSEAQNKANKIEHLRRIINRSYYKRKSKSSNSNSKIRSYSDSGFRNLYNGVCSFFGC